MATKKKLVSLKKTETIATRLKHLTHDCHNHNKMTTLDVEQMCVSTDELTNAIFWLEEVALGDTQCASHALALCWLIELYAR